MRAPNEDELAIIQRDAPDIFDMVHQAKEGDIDKVVFTIDAFASEPELLHAVVWYITSQGLTVFITGVDHTS